MDPLKAKCPLEGCRLLHLGWARQVAPAGAVSYHYCPPCTVAFLVVDERQSGGRLSVLKARLEDPQLVYYPPDVSRAVRLTDREIALHRDELNAAVRRFLEGRMGTKQVRCAKNHGPADPIAQWGVMMSRSLYLSGCDACLIAFVQARDDDYGWELALSFGFDVGPCSWVLKEIHRASMDPSVVQECLRLLEGVRSGYDPATRTFANRPWGIV